MTNEANESEYVLDWSKHAKYQSTALCQLTQDDFILYCDGADLNFDLFAQTVENECTIKGCTSCWMGLPVYRQKDSREDDALFDMMETVAKLCACFNSLYATEVSLVIVGDASEYLLAKVMSSFLVLSAIAEHQVLEFALRHQYSQKELYILKYEIARARVNEAAQYFQKTNPSISDTIKRWRINEIPESGLREKVQGCSKIKTTAARKIHWLFLDVDSKRDSSTCLELGKKLHVDKYVFIASLFTESTDMDELKLAEKNLKSVLRQNGFITVTVKVSANPSRVFKNPTLVKRLPYLYDRYDAFDKSKDNKNCIDSRKTSATTKKKIPELADY